MTLGEAMSPTKPLDLRAIEAERYDWWNQGAPVAHPTDAREASERALQTRDALLAALRASLVALKKFTWDVQVDSEWSIVNKRTYMDACDEAAAVLAKVKDA